MPSLRHWQLIFRPLGILVQLQQGRNRIHMLAHGRLPRVLGSARWHASGTRRSVNGARRAFGRKPGAERCAMVNVNRGQAKDARCGFQAAPGFIQEPQARPDDLCFLSRWFARHVERTANG